MKSLGSWVAACVAAWAGAAAAAPPDLGPNVTIFTPEMSRSEIQAKVDEVAANQRTAEFGAARYALLFQPGSYGSADDPLNFQVGYYTAVAGLGRSPTDVTVNGSINVYNQCNDSGCIALNNFWRALSNLSIQVSNGALGCYAGQFWAVSQAAPMRRVKVTGQTTLMDYCTGPSFASGGFIADSQFTGGPVINGSQQQWLVRNSAVDSWSNGVWNQVFSGVIGAPAGCFPADASCGGPYTTLPSTPVIREAPYLFVDAEGRWQVFVPSLQRDAVGPSWTNGPTAGRAIPIEDFLIVKPETGTTTINRALARGKHLLFTPGIYAIDRTIRITRADTIVLGLGLPTLVPQNGVVAMDVADVPGVGIAGVVFDAGPVNSKVLLRVGRLHSRQADPENPIALHDVFFRIGGMAAGSATASLKVLSDHVILDNTWAWRADHGNGVGWTVNPADTGVVVQGDDVSAYGLFVEHYQKYQVIWNGERGRVVFFQNEMPYDPPSQEAWSSGPGVEGWAAFKVTDKVTTFNGWAMGSYSFFNQGLDIFASNAFEVPSTLAPGSLTNMLTIFLDPGTGKGGIRNVVNGIGGSSTIANADVPVTVTAYPPLPAATRGPRKAR